MDSRLSQNQIAPDTHGRLVPGDSERESEAIRREESILLLQPVIDDLMEISKKTGIPFKPNENGLLSEIAAIDAN